MYTAYRSTQPRTELGTGTGMCGPAPPQSQADPALRNMLECDNVSREHKGWIFFFFLNIYTIAPCQSVALHFVLKSSTDTV